MALSNLTFAKRQLQKFCQTYNSKKGYNCLTPSPWWEGEGTHHCKVYVIDDYLPKELFEKVEKANPFITFVGVDFDDDGVFLMLKLKNYDSQEKNI